MPIRELSSLPKIMPVNVDAPGGGGGGDASRMMLDLIDNEIQQRREQQRGTLANLHDFSNWQDKNRLVADTPFQKGVADDIKAITSQYSEELKNISDPVEQARRYEKIKSDIRNHPDFASAEREKLVVANWLDFVGKNQDKVAPEVVAKAWQTIQDPNRKTALSPSDLPMGYGLMSADDYADSELKKLTHSKSVAKYDEDNNRTYTKTTRSFVVDDEDAVVRLADKLATHPEFKGKDREEVMAAAAKRFQDFSYRNIKTQQGEVIAENKDWENYSSDKDAMAKKETTGNQRIKEFNTSLTSPGGAGMGGDNGFLEHDVDNGNYILYDKDKKVRQTGGLGDMWHLIPDAEQRKLIASGRNPTLFTIRGTGKAIVGSKPYEDAMFDVTGLNPADKQVVVSSGKANVVNIVPDKNGTWLETNNPAVVRSNGFTELKYDDASKKYYVVDKAGVKHYEGDADGVLETRGGATETRSAKSTYRGFGNILSGGKKSIDGTPRMFRVRLDDRKPEADGGDAVGSFMKTGNAIVDFIAAGESGSAGDGAINADDANTGRPSIGVLQFNSAEHHNELMSAVGRQKEWRAIMKAKPGERKAMYKQLYDGLDADEKQAFRQKTLEIAERDYWGPAREIFEENFGVAIPDVVMPLWAAMAGQHYKGMLENQELVNSMDPDTVSEFVQTQDMEGLVNYISDRRKAYRFVKGQKGLEKRVEDDRKRALELVKTGIEPAAAPDASQDVPEDSGDVRPESMMTPGIQQQTDPPKQTTTTPKNPAAPPSPPAAAKQDSVNIYRAPGQPAVKPAVKGKPGVKELPNVGPDPKTGSYEIDGVKMSRLEFLKALANNPGLYKKGKLVVKNDARVEELVSGGSKKPITRK